MPDTSRKVAIHKNPDRGKSTPYKPYVPQYQVHGIEPQEYNGNAVVPGTQIARSAALPLDNPRSKRPVIRQPYASPTPSPLGKGLGLPNVGNNVEHTWSSVDGDIEDDVGFDPNHPMIDNNEFVTPQALGFQSGVLAENLQRPSYGKVSFEEVAAPTAPDLQSGDDLLSIVTELDADSYLLIVSNVPLCSGPMEEIQDQARALVFGEHEICAGNPIPIDDIIILKRVKVKVGLFLE